MARTTGKSSASRASTSSCRAPYSGGIMPHARPAHRLAGLAEQRGDGRDERPGPAPRGHRSLTGQMAEHYDVYYRVRSTSAGWAGQKNGQSAPAAGYAYRPRHRDRIVPKGAPHLATANAFRQKK